MKIGFGIPLSGSWATPDIQRRLVGRAEELGYHSAWTFQRLVIPAVPEDGRWAEVYRSVHDPLVSLAYLAGHTTRIRLGFAVLNMPFFSPAQLAKQLTTLDVFSGGRLDVGLGLGWSREEFGASGVAYGRRGARSEEFLAVLRALWTGDDTEFHGEFYDFPPVRLDPRPVQRPHPPLLLGAFSEPALKRAGRLADGWISSSRADLTKLGESIDAIKKAAREAGRDPESLRFVCRGVVRVGPAGQPGRAPLSGSYEEIRADLDGLRAQGVTEVFYDLNYDPTIGTPDADPAESARRAEQALSALAP